MRSLIGFLVLSLHATYGLSRAVELDSRDAGNITLAAPVVGVPSQHWDGVAGTWSSFEIHVGNNVQNTYRVMPATSWQETWLVFGNEPERYCNTSLGVPADCAESRGGVYQNTSSTSWNQSFFTAPGSNQLFLQLDTNLGESGQGIYGFETIGLGFAAGQGQPTLNNSILAEMVSDTWWLGIFGMGFQPTNFSGFADPQPSYASVLFSEGLISSKTWSYTAGAFYRLKGVFGSMIFGGYDATRFVPNDVRFTMAPDNLRDVVLSIRSISSTDSSGTTTKLSSTPDLFYIDSAVPELWLPLATCQQFEKAFGIELDPNADIYLVNESTRSHLLTLNPNITFTLGDQNSGGTTVDITLPYSAFDQNITAPLYSGTSFWFPLMQTTDSKDNTLGRTFLQEAYVTANYHTRTFNVSQAVFNDDSVSAKIIAIPSTVPTSTPTGGNGSGGNGSTGSASKKLSGGAIAGIVIGVLAVFAVAGSVLSCCLLGLLCFPSRKHKDSTPSTPVHEIDTGKRIDPKASAYQSQASNFTSEVSGQDAKVEIQGNPIMHPQELEADVPMLAGGRHSERVNGLSASSRATEDSNVSSLSPITEQKTPMAELGAQERGLGYGTSMGERGTGDEHIVSPNSPSVPPNSLMGRGRPSVTTGSPSTVSEATWSPSSPVQRKASGSKFRESLDY